MSIITVSADFESWVTGVTDFITELATTAIAERGRFTFAFSGGNTPRPVYERLASAGYSERIDWSRVQVFFGDERCVPPEDPLSNYHMARTALGDRLPIPAANIHRIHGEDPPEQAAAEYAQELKRTFGGEANKGGPPQEGFDLVLLGMGDNGHTASLFPGTSALDEERRWVVDNIVRSLQTVRITMTLPVFNHARNVWFLVSGAKKAVAFKRAQEDEDPACPASLVRPENGVLRWYVDKAVTA